MNASSLADRPALKVLPDRTTAGRSSGMAARASIDPVQRVTSRPETVRVGAGVLTGAGGAETPEPEGDAGEGGASSTEGAGGRAGGAATDGFGSVAAGVIAAGAAKEEAGEAGGAVFEDESPGRGAATPGRPCKYLFKKPDILILY